MSHRNIERLHQVICRSLFTINGTLGYDRVTDGLIKLANTVLETETDESTWCIGEYGAACLDDLIIGAFWHYVEWHRGQDSKEYLALSVLGQIYSPGMEPGPEEGSGSKDVYEQLEEMAGEQS